MNNACSGAARCCCGAGTDGFEEQPLENNKPNPQMNSLFMSLTL